MNKAAKIFGGFGLLAGLGTAGYFVYKKKKDADLKNAKQNRILFTKSELSGFYGVLYGLKELNLAIPAIPDKFYEADQVQGVKEKLADIKKKYDREIRQAEQLTNLPYEMIAGLIFIESGGNASIISSAGAIGLTQITPDTANAAIVKEQLTGRLSEAEKVIFRKYLPEPTLITRKKQKIKVSRLDAILEQKNLGGPTLIKVKDLQKPELNILLGSMFFKLLVDQSTSGNLVRLEKAIVRYNGGYNKSVPGNTLQETLAQIKSTETKAYILKMMGKNGVLEIQLS
jgi:hypothetical protein